MNIPERDFKFLSSENIGIGPLNLFHLFIIKAHFNLISADTNINVETKRVINEHENNSQEEEEEIEEGTTLSAWQTKHIRVWNDTTGTEIARFVGILFLQGEAKVGDTEKYWTCQSDRMLFPSIQSTMTVIRWQQIKR